MATFTLTIECDNDAFISYPGPEIARILENVSYSVRKKIDRNSEVSIRDSNGNRVGSWEYQEKGETND